MINFNSLTNILINLQLNQQIYKNMNKIKKHKKINYLIF